MFSKQKITSPLSSQLQALHIDVASGTIHLAPPKCLPWWDFKLWIIILYSISLTFAFTLLASF